MAAGYYSAGTENRDHMEDPSEDGLFMLLSKPEPGRERLHHHHRRRRGPAWYVSVTLLGYGTFEVERHGTCHGEHDQRIQTGPGDIARSLVICPAAGDYPGRPARRSTPGIWNRP
jgi:hypothetical protein